LSINYRTERSPLSKLKNEDIIHIRSQMDKGVFGTTLASELNVNPSTIYNIKHKKRWKHI